jgi:hypothetical protein
MRALLHRNAAVVLVTIAAAVLAGGAGAYWSSAAASGSGSALAGSASALTLTTGTPADSLYPGGSAELAVSVVNADPHRVFVGSLTLDTGQGAGGFAVDGGHPGCDLSALAYTTQTNGGAGWFIAPSSTLDLHLANAVTLGPAAPSACQGASFTVYLQAGP